jgi:hypothetical protein
MTPKQVIRIMRAAQGIAMTDELHDALDAMIEECEAIEREDGLTDRIDAFAAQTLKAVTAPPTPEPSPVQAEAERLEARRQGDEWARQRFAEAVGIELQQPAMDAGQPPDKQQPYEEIGHHRKMAEAKAGQRVESERTVKGMTVAINFGDDTGLAVAFEKWALSGEMNRALDVWLGRTPTGTEWPNRSERWASGVEQHGTGPSTIPFANLPSEQATTDTNPDMRPVPDKHEFEPGEIDKAFCGVPNCDKPKPHSIHL